MSQTFKCQCGATIVDQLRPKDCETCPICNSKIVADGEEYDTPLDHAVVRRETNENQCKRCGKIM